MLIENTLEGPIDKVKIAIARIKLNVPKDGKGYYVAFSGGKDSCVVLDLVKRAGVKYDAHYNLTTVDPPELIYFIREHHQEVIVDRPEKTMWELIVKKKWPPMRHMRYCCQVLKEGGGLGRTVVTGVRWQESARRAKRKLMETCNQHRDKKYLHPIIDWSGKEVWEYIHMYHLPYCKLYDEGFKRIGCVMCPFQGKAGVQRDIDRWPKIANAYRLAINKAFQKRIKDGNKQNFKTGDELYYWWISQDSRVQANDQQINLFGIQGDESFF